MQKTERSDQEFFEEIREKDNIMQILGPEVGGGHLYMRPFDQNLGDASPPSLLWIPMIFWQQFRGVGII